MELSLKALCVKFLFMRSRDSIEEGHLTFFGFTERLLFISLEPYYDHYFFFLCLFAVFIGVPFRNLYIFLPTKPPTHQKGNKKIQELEHIMLGSLYIGLIESSMDGRHSLYQILT